MKPEEMLVGFILAAKAIIYDAKRAAPLLAMLATKSGAVGAVQAVLAAIDKTKPVPQPVRPLLGVSVLMLLLDVVKEVTGQSPPKEMIAQVAEGFLLELVSGKQPEQPAAQPVGLINQGA